MKYMGSAVKMALVTSNLPACESIAYVQVSLLSHLLTKGRKSNVEGWEGEYVPNPFHG